MTTVEVYCFHRGERWFGARFKHPQKGWICQAYGSTEKELEERINQILEFEFGSTGYTIHFSEIDIA